MEATFVWVLALALGWGGLCASANPFRVEPQNTDAALGETAVLPCILRNTTLSQCNVFWYRSDEQIYISRKRRIIDHLSADIKERYSILGNQSSGDYSLQIRDVVEADAGEYRCNCFSRSHADSYLSPAAAIYIVVRPPEEYPACRIRDGTGSLMVGQRVSFVCETIGGRPSVALQWMRGTENIVADFTFNPHSISVYHKTLTLEDSDATLTCVASGLALKSPRNCTIGPLSVISPLQIQTQKVIAKHGTRRDPRVVFTCNSNVNHTGQATTYNYTWYANSIRVTTATPGFVLASDGMSIQVTDLSLFSQNIHIVCAAHGTQGSLGNVSTFLDMESIAGFPTIPHDGYPKTDPPVKGIVSIPGNNKYFDIRPFIYLVLGAFVLMTTMIAIVVCTPRSCCHAKSDSRLRRRDSQFTTMHYVQQPSGSPARAIAHQESLNLYESTTDSDTESTRQGAAMTLTAPPLSQQQKQQVQATLHVVVHSGNNPTNQRRTNSGSLNDDQSSVYQEVPPLPPPLPPHSSNTLRLHPPVTSSASATLRTQTWGHSSCKSNPFGYRHVPSDMMHYDHLGGCYVQTLPMKQSRPPLHQKFLYTPQYAELNKLHHKGTVESMYENVPIHHGRSLSLTTAGY